MNSDPPRIDEGEPSELGNLVRAARRRAPSDAVAARMTKRLAASGALGALSSAATSSGRFGRLGLVKLGALAFVGICASLVVWQIQSAAQVEVAPVPPTATPLATPPPQPTLVASAMANEPPVIAVEALPSSASTAVSVPAPAPAPSLRPTAARASSQAPVPARRREVEYALIQRAEDALRSDPSSALTAVDEHTRLFPSGELVQEREVVAVESLMRLGQKDDAKHRANAMLENFPRTPYVARLERALGEPLVSPSSRMKAPR